MDIRPEPTSTLIPWAHVDSAIVPKGETLELWGREGEFVIRSGTRVLMTSRVHGSEEALADLACEQVQDRLAPRVLIGGLGMGFTLAAALRKLPPTARVVVAELVPAVVAWNRGPVGHLAGYPLRDGRVEVRTSDVSAILRDECRAFDAILLDVDNGPEGFTRDSNAWLYRSAGLKAAWHALRARGVLAVWSASSDSRFFARLRGAGFKVDEVPVRAAGGRGPKHCVWVARRP